MKHSVLYLEVSEVLRQKTCVSETIHSYALTLTAESVPLSAFIHFAKGTDDFDFFFFHFATSFPAVISFSSIQSSSAAVHFNILTFPL